MLSILTPTTRSAPARDYPIDCVVPLEPLGRRSRLSTATTALATAAMAAIRSQESTAIGAVSKTEFMAGR